MDKPMLQVYCGDGKGKTTAAVGLAVRAAGAGLHVFFTQFMKGDESSELRVLRTVPGIEIMKPEKHYGFSFEMDDGQKREITACHNAILDAALRHLKNGDADVIVFDEIFSAYSCGLLDEEKVHRVLSVPQTAEIVMTGRDPAEWILSEADYITEMRLVRHPYEKGISARRGIEF